MSNTDAPNVNTDGEITNQELLIEQSGIPAMTKKFTIETDTEILGDLDVTGTVTATSFIGDGSQLTGISGGTGGGLDSAAVTLLVDSDYVQARETPQDFAYSSLTGAPTALSSFTNDTSYITAADIPATVDSDYVAARSPAVSGGLDSAAVISLTGTEVQTSAGGIDYSAQSRLRVEDGAIGLSTIDADTLAESLTYSGGTWNLAGNPSGASSQRITHHLWSSSYSNAALSAANDVYVGSRYAGTKFSYPAMTSYVPTAAQFGGGFEWDHAGTTVLDLSTDGAVFSSSVTATSFVGDGSGLTNLPSGGGLDSAAVNTLIDAEVQDPTTLILGTSSNAGVRLGSGATTNGLSGGSVSIGTNANSYIQSVAIGSSATASGTGSVAVGPNSGGTGNFITAIGRQAETSGSNSLALGYSASSGNYGIALGDATSGNQSIAIGALASATIDNALHINANYNSGVGPTTNGGLVIETSDARLEYSAASDWEFSATVNAPAFVGDGSGLTNLPSGGGGLDSAAVNAMIDSDLAGAESPNSYTMKIGANASRIAIGTGAVSERVNSISIGTNAGRYVTGGTGHIIIGDQAGGAAIGGGGQAINIVAIGTGASTNLSSAQYETIAIGYNAGRTDMGNYAVAIGSGASTSSAGDQTVALGYNAEATADYAVSIGDNATVSNPAIIGIAIGRNTSVTTPGGVGGIAIGSGASVSADDTLAIGRNTVASASDATAIGPNTTASGLRSIAIGNNVTAITDDAVTIGSSVAGRVTYDTTNDWVFGAGVTMTDLTASGATVVFSNLPTTDPVNAGQLWNDNGTLKVSAG